jgi:hypothetical protein
MINIDGIASEAIGRIKGRNVAESQGMWHRFRLLKIGPG